MDHEEHTMASNDPNATTNRHKVIGFIPYKTMAMDLESILANLTRVYVNRNDVEMVEIVTLAEAELFPIGSFDPEAERYEYVLKLAVPAKFHTHLRDNINTIQPQLQKDIATVTAAYQHEHISNVYVVIKIDQDATWREGALEWVATQPDAGKGKDRALFLCHAEADGDAIVKEMKTIFARQGVRMSSRALTSVRPKDIQHLLGDFEKTTDFGILVVSAALVRLPFAEESIEQLTSYVKNPGKRFCQIWNDISRTDVATFSAGLAGSLAYTTQRMSVEQICQLLLTLAAIEVR
jgi:hypothetical protein